MFSLKQTMLLIGNVTVRAATSHSKGPEICCPWWCAQPKKDDERA